METTHIHISQLIERFMEGQSTLAEEQELAEYFATHEMSEEWKPLQAMFAYFDAGMPLEEKTTRIRVPLAKRLWWRVAAAILLVGGLAAVFIFSQQPTNRMTQKYAEASQHNIPQSIDTTEQGSPDALPAKPLAVEHIATVQTTKPQPGKRKVTPHDEGSQSEEDSIEITRKQGQVELAQQELLADRIIIEQEREQMRREQMETRSRMLSTREAMNYNYNNQPQATMVVFK
ncbi:MAG: hypothetical protein J5523_08900 [Muribaculaceae bacterium]|nr:hypothetical protein [Muribaculaceae bacterium]